MCHSSCPCSFVVMAKYGCTLPVWHSHALHVWPAPGRQPSKKVFVALSHLNIFSNMFAENNMTILLPQKMFRNYNSSFSLFLTVQYLIIYYIPTNCTNLLFIYKQHIKTFVLFKLRSFRSLNNTNVLMCCL